MLIIEISSSVGQVRGSSRDQFTSGTCERKQQGSVYQWDERERAAVISSPVGHARGSSRDQFTSGTREREQHGSVYQWDTREGAAGISLPFGTLKGVGRISLPVEHTFGIHYYCARRFNILK